MLMVWQLLLLYCWCDLAIPRNISVSFVDLLLSEPLNWGKYKLSHAILALSKALLRPAAKKNVAKMPFLVTSFELRHGCFTPSHPFHLWNSVQHDVGQFSGHSQVSEHLETLKQHGCLFFCFSHCHGIQLTTFRLQFIILIMLISPFAIVTKKWACHFAVCSTCSEWFWNTSTCALAAAASAAGSVDFSKTPHTVHDAFNALHSLQTTATTNNSSNNDK